MVLLNGLFVAFINFLALLVQLVFDEVVRASPSRRVQCIVIRVEVIAAL